MGPEFQLRKTNSSGDGWWWRLQDRGRHTTPQAVKIVNVLPCAFYHNRQRKERKGNEEERKEGREGGREEKE